MLKYPSIFPQSVATALAGDSMFRSHRSYIFLIGVVAWSFTATDTVFLILDAVSLYLANASTSGLAIGASALDVIALGCVGLFTFLHAWRREGNASYFNLRSWTLPLLCITISIAALGLSLVLHVMVRKRWNPASHDTMQVTISNWPGQFAAHFTIWSLACLSQAILFSLPFWSGLGLADKRPNGQSNPRDSVMSEIQPSGQAASSYILEPPPILSPMGEIPSPTYSSRSSQSLKSWRESFQLVVRPVTSRTKLLSRNSFNRDSRNVYSDAQSVDNTSQSDGFDAWDTSGVESQTRDALVQSAPSRGTVLEPIPGSRPPSPARALDGPFSMVVDEDDSSLSLPPKIMPDTSRPPSPAVSEAHIHPLFRTESPTPPPAATPGTNIMASPLSAQMIPFSRMRSNSRGASPSPLIHSQSFRDRAMSANRPSRSQSPPIRRMTPPIPDFVLNSSPRSSMNSRRGANVQPELTL